MLSAIFTVGTLKWIAVSFVALAGINAILGVCDSSGIVGEILNLLGADIDSICALIEFLICIALAVACLIAIAVLKH